jgi:3-oxoacyl-[acyl-carrier protein] reductase
VSSYKLDLDSETECSDYEQYLLNKHDSIFGFIHNAGITKIGHLSLLSEEDWRLVFNVNIINIFPLLKAVSNNMILQKNGTIVFIASIAGVQPAEGQASYASSKSALIALTRSLGKELGRFNIRVNCISPGFVDTEMVKSLSKKYLDNLRKQIPFNRFSKPIEIAKVINFLISEDASYINCSNIVVDGGLT